MPFLAKRGTLACLWARMGTVLMYYSLRQSYGSIARIEIEMNYQYCQNLLILVQYQQQTYVELVPCPRHDRAPGHGMLIQKTRHDACLLRHALYVARLVPYASNTNYIIHQYRLLQKSGEQSIKRYIICEPGMLNFLNIYYFLKKPKISLQQYT